MSSHRSTGTIVASVVVCIAAVSLIAIFVFYRRWKLARISRYRTLIEDQCPTTLSDSETNFNRAFSYASLIVNANDDEARTYSSLI